MPSFRCFLCLISHCVCLLRLCFGGNILGCRPPISPVLPPEAPGEGPSCLFQLLGAPGGPGLVAASLPALPPSSRGFSSVSGSPLLSLRRTLSLDGGPPSSRRTSSQTLPMASPLYLGLLLCLLGGHGPCREGHLIQEDLVPGAQLLNHSKFLIPVSRASLVFPEKPRLTCLC